MSDQKLRRRRPLALPGLEGLAHLPFAFSIMATNRANR